MEAKGDEKAPTFSISPPTLPYEGVFPISEGSTKP